MAEAIHDVRPGTTGGMMGEGASGRIATGGMGGGMCAGETAVMVDAMGMDMGKGTVMQEEGTWGAKKHIEGSNGARRAW